MSLDRRVLFGLEKVGEKTIDGSNFVENGTRSAFAVSSDREGQKASVEARSEDGDLVGDAKHLWAWERLTIASRANRQAGNETRARILARMAEFHLTRAEEIRKAREEETELRLFRSIPKVGFWARLAAIFAR